jgi:4-amino-4-deoxy-L-arabinose transferase-like glycosyltransferase
MRHTAFRISNFEFRNLLLILIVLVGAALRLYQLDAVPPGFQFDEAYNALDAAHVLELGLSSQRRIETGEWQIFFPANGGREPLYTYWQALLFALLGENLFALRLASALVGVLTLPLAFGAVRYLFRSHPRANGLGLLTAGFLAVSFWHLHFSHYAIRAVLLPPILLATLWVFWYGQATGRPWAFLAAGLGLAAGAYTHPAARFLPLLLILFSLSEIMIDRTNLRRQITSLVLAGLVSLVLFLPLGLYFLEHPWLFAGHPSDVSVFDPRVHQGDLAGTLLRHALQLGGMFLWRGDPSWLHNLPRRPVFDPLSGLAFLAGVLVWARALLRRPSTGRRPYVYLALWVAVMALPSLFSDNPPNFSRAIGALPAICAFPALGLVGVWDWGSGIRDQGSGPWRACPLLAALLIVASGLWTAYDYYVAFAQAPEAYYWYDGDKGEVVDVLADLVVQGQVYMAPPWVKHATVDFLTRGWGVKEVALGSGVVLPDPAAGRDAYYVLRTKDAGESRFVGRRLGPSDEQWEVHDRYGEPLIFVHHLPVEAIPDGVPSPAHEMHAVFGDLFEFLGYTMDSEVEAGDRLDVFLFWRSLRPAPLNYTQFLHLLDQDGRRWGQRDREPLDGTYRTSEWEPGEVIIDRFRLIVDPAVPPGPYELLVGWYDLETGERLPVLDEAGEVAGDHVILGPVQVGEGS